MKLRKAFCIALLTLASLLFFPCGSWAQGVQAWMHLEIDGTVIEGDSMVSSLERDGTIEIYGFGQNIFVIDDGLGGRLEAKPIQIIKLIDKSSVFLLKALVNSEDAEAYIRFYRIGGDSIEELYYTIHLENAKILRVSPSVAPATTSEPSPELWELVSISCSKITWIDEANSNSTTWNAIPN